MGAFEALAWTEAGFAEALVAVEPEASPFLPLLRPLTGAAEVAECVRLASENQAARRELLRLWLGLRLVLLRCRLLLEGVLPQMT